MRGQWKPALLLAILASFSAASCGTEEVDIEGKACPCPAPDYQCDPVCKVCVPSGSPAGALCGGGSGGAAGGAAGGTGGGSGGAGATSGGASGGGGTSGSGGAACQPVITFKNFTAVWATPESIQWEWEPDNPVADADKLAGYTIVVSASGKTDKVFDAKTNPELGVYVQPNGGADLSRRSVTSGLEPGVSYTGVLRARDTAGCTFESAPAGAPQTTLAKGVSQVVFKDATPAGAFAQDCSLVSTGCHAGSGCLRSVDCQDATCWANMRWSDMSISVPVSSGEFTQAYLEMYVRSDSTAPLWWTQTWIQIGTEKWYFAPRTLLADGAYHKLQFPLRKFETGTGSLFDTAALATPIDEILFVGAGPSVGTHIWVDEVYVRW
ncbi:MAG: hypothetical protein R3B13_30055 [Polyangiaceae bacterium]